MRYFDMNDREKVMRGKNHCILYNEKPKKIQRFSCSFSTFCSLFPGVLDVAPKSRLSSKERDLWREALLYQISHGFYSQIHLEVREK